MITARSQNVVCWPEVEFFYRREHAQLNSQPREQQIGLGGSAGGMKFNSPSPPLRVRDSLEICLAKVIVFRQCIVVKQRARETNYGLINLTLCFIRRRTPPHSMLACFFCFVLWLHNDSINLHSASINFFFNSNYDSI